MPEKNVTSSVNTWNYKTNHVQESIQIGEFTNSKQALICAGPPKLLNIGGNVPTAAGTDDVLAFNDSNQSIAFPIGITNNFSLVSNKAWSQMFEIGSERAYQIPGHTVYSSQMSRVLYSGPSLLKTLYAYYGRRFNDNAKFKDYEPSVVYSELDNMPEVYDAPGFKDLFLNLGSDLFDQLFGMLIIFEDTNMKTIGAIYLEECAINGHSLNLDANGTMIVEGCGFRPSRVVPVQIEVNTTGAENMVWSK